MCMEFIEENIVRIVAAGNWKMSDDRTGAWRWLENEKYM